MWANNGDLLLTGYKGHPDAGYIFIADDSEGFVIRANTEGDLIWEKPISVAQGAKIRKTTDGYFICCTQESMDQLNIRKLYAIVM